ncbi:Uncharacterised protein [Myroides odoratimimus]|nr:Uncharacterised protein [Myroides odoratimimus]
MEKTSTGYCLISWVCLKLTSKKVLKVAKSVGTKHKQHIVWLKGILSHTKSP